MSDRLLICTDLDRTLLPNGEQPESPEARPRFAAVAAHEEVCLVYVTGRHRELVEQALDDYALPLPRFVIADVGTTIYSITSADWQVCDAWSDAISPDWAGMSHDRLHALFADIEALTLQEPEKQQTFKLSYYAPADIDASGVLDRMRLRMEQRGIRADLVWSIDETGPIGLLDVLPPGATKLRAIEFLMARQEYGLHNSLFAGDSGNDLPVLGSPIRSVLVANATEDVRREALTLAEKNHTRDALFLARGGFAGMNGNYSAGILEGLTHYFPQTRGWWE